MGWRALAFNVSRSFSAPVRSIAYFELRGGRMHDNGRGRPISEMRVPSLGCPNEVSVPRPRTARGGTSMRCELRNSEERR